MRSSRALWIAAIVPVLIGACAFPIVWRVLRPAKSSSTVTTGKSASKADESNLPPPRVPVLGTVPAFELVDQDGQAFGTWDVQDKVWVANFIFTRCQATCPIQTSVLARFQRELAQGKGRGTMKEPVHLVSISVDPEVDTPQRLSAYAAEHGADLATWSFLTGDRAQIWKLCGEGFKLPVAGNPTDDRMPIAHSSQFILVDYRGRIRGYYDGVKPAEVQQLLADLTVVRSEPVYLPPEIRDTSWMSERRDQQLATLGKFQVFCGFQFEDRVRDSGITFRCQVTDDAGRTQKQVHYDHGCGLAAADVDGDGLADLCLVSQVGGPALYRNRGGGRFEDITTSSGIALPTRICVSASFADTDNDGDQDLFITTVRHGNVLLENDGGGKFQDISRSAGLDYVGHSSAGLFFDYDRDGLVDLFLCNVGKYTSDEATRIVGYSAEQPTNVEYYVGLDDAFAGHIKPERSETNILYRNLGGNRFQDVTDETGLIDETWAGDAAVIDANGDGWPDLYVLSMQGNDEYFENTVGQKFTKRSRELFPLTPWGSMGIEVFDFDGDGLMDIFITDMHSDMGPALDWMLEKTDGVMVSSWPESWLVTVGQSIFGNALFRNRGDGTFEEIADKVNGEQYWPWGPSAADLNADGHMDLFIAASMCYPLRYGVNTVFLNNRGVELLDSEFILGVEPRRGGRTATPWFELDVSGVDRNHRLVETAIPGRQGRVCVWGPPCTRAAVVFDLDRDGDLDIVTNDFGTEPMVLISNLSDKLPTLSWLEVELAGSKSNRDGLGAVVTVRLSDHSLVQVHDGKSGYMSQSAIPLYFGLGDAGQAEEITVRWPSGAEQKLAGPIPARQRLRIEEPL